MAAQAPEQLAPARARYARAPTVLAPRSVRASADSFGAALAPGATFTQTFNTAGNFPFFLTNNPQFTGSVLVFACDAAFTQTGTGDDSINGVGGAGNDTIHIYGGAGNDTINVHGGDGTDTIYVYGEDGDDTITYQVSDGNDVALLDGGTGNDSRTINAGSQSITVLDGATGYLIYQQGSGGSTITVFNIERITIYCTDGSVCYSR